MFAKTNNQIAGASNGSATPGHLPVASATVRPMPGSGYRSNHGQYSENLPEPGGPRAQQGEAQHFR